MDDFGIYFAWFVVFVISATVHEAAHAYAAYKMGDKTAYHGGQVTLDPLPHIRREPFGMIIVPIISLFYMGWPIGWASCPYDPNWASRNPRKAAWMGIAGPGGNFILILVASAAIHIGIWTGFFFRPESIGFKTIVASNSEGLARAMASFLSLLFTMNLLLLTFNLIPFPPLDGTSLVELSLKGQKLTKYRMLMNQQAVRIFGIIIAWRLFGFIFDPVFKLALSILYPGSHYQ